MTYPGTGPNVAAKPVENGIHHARLVAFEEGMCDFDIFIDDDLERHILASPKFICSATQDRTQGCVQSSQRPAFGQRRIHLNVELSLLPHHTPNDILEVHLIGRKYFIVALRLFKPMLDKLFNHLVEWRRRYIHLIKRLDGEKSRSSARSRIEPSRRRLLRRN